DFGERLIGPLHEDTPPEHMTIRKISLRKRMVHHHDARTGEAVSTVEGPAVQNWNADFHGMDVQGLGRIKRVLVENNQPVRAWIRQWSKQDGVHEREDRCICTNADGE